MTNKENAAALITDWVLRELQPTACIAELSAFLEQQSSLDEDIAYVNCLLRGREIAIGQPEPDLSTGRDALLALWQAVPQVDRDRINEACERTDALLKREGLYTV